ncbi:MAG: DUF937 domain-containing protein [Calditrichaeota bacterium]|nr:DUF937 domain-containing protein [Calditrichota bacterium]
MAGFVDEFMASLGPQVTKELSKNLGIKKNIANQVIPQLVPMILSGLKKQKDEYGGPERVDHILNKYGDPSVLDNLAGLFSQKKQDDSVDPRLGGLLGDSGIKATQMIAEKFNLSGNSAAKLIPMLAPVVLGALTRKRDNEGAGTTGIAALLDQDGDGSILDDVAGFLMQGLFGSGSGKTGSGGGVGNLLGGLLGGLFGGKRR